MPLQMRVARSYNQERTNMRRRERDNQEEAWVSLGYNSLESGRAGYLRGLLFGEEGDPGGIKFVSNEQYMEQLAQVYRHVDRTQVCLLFVCLFVCFVVCLFVCLFCCLFVCFVVCLFVYLFVCLFVCLLFRSQCPLTALHSTDRHGISQSKNSSYLYSGTWRVTELNSLTYEGC